MSAHEHPNYVKIWGILVILLVISVLGPFLEIKIVTLITAFGIAGVKAWMVAKHFMHVTIQPRYVMYILTTSLVFMLLFYAGTAPDVMRHDGHNWVKAQVPTAIVGGHGDDHGDSSHGEGHGDDSHGGDHH